MDFLGEFIGELLGELWGNLAEKMFNPAYSRRKRVFCFLLFYLPLAALIILFGALIYERTDIICIVISYALYALAAFLFFFLGRKAWLGRAPKKPKAIGGLSKGIEGYKNTVNDKNMPLGIRIALFALPYLLMLVGAALLMVIFPDLSSLGIVVIGVCFVSAIVLGTLIFGKKK